MNKKIISYSIVLTVIAVLSLGCNLFNPDLSKEQKKLVKELNGLIIPLTGSSPALGHGELAPLSFLGNARIVGLGEATHCSKEFFQMKHRVFQYLVEEYGFRAFAFEYDFGASIYFDRYITTGEGNLDELLKTRMYFWMWRTEEVKALMEWMRNYNEGKEYKDMIRFVGIDCQGIMYNSIFLTEYLEKVSPELLEASRSLLAKIAVMNSSSYIDMTEVEMLDIHNQLQWLYDQLVEMENELVSFPGREEYEMTLRLVRVLEQSNEILYKVIHSATMPPRDKYMAENALWLADRFFGKNVKIAVWAHNYHVANYSTSGAAPLPMLGRCLKDALGESYQIVAFGFSKGGFMATVMGSSGKLEGPVVCNIDATPLKSSINYLFHHAKYKNFIFRHRDLSPGSDLSDWLSVERPFLALGAVYRWDPYEFYADILLTKEYDITIYFDEVTAAGLIPIEVP